MKQKHGKSDSEGDDESGEDEDEEDGEEEDSLDDSEARENLAEMIEAGEFDSSDAEDFYDDEEESEDSDMMEDDEESSEEEFPEDSFEAKYGEPRIEVLEETIQEPALPEVKRKGKKAKSEKESSNKTSM